MAEGDGDPIRRGDRGFLVRLVGGGLAVIVLAILLLNVLDSSNLGGCASRGFDQVTETPPSH
ncbi:MAG: hypothetical protein AAF436_06350 [Myxococcota bacterium]